MTDGHPDGKKATADLLRRLRSADAGSAWAEFLDRYASLIMNTASQFEYEQDRISECFLYACAQLNDNGFRRLLKFNTAGEAAFRTWLGSVVFNLCVDWHRREYGRASLLPAISALPAFDQSVYRMVIEQGMGKETCFQSLKADFPDLTRELVAKAAARVYALLTPRQRWQISVRNRGCKPAYGDPVQGRIDRLPDPAGGPEQEAQRQQELESLQIAIARLPADQRLLLRLRFQEGLTLRKIAQLKYHGDTNATWRGVEAAVDALFQRLQVERSAQQRKN
ncbi:MAG TPA: sigma-70 family RNA polymerase sigma factor [Woeseiaceae bacterium]